MPKDTSHTHQFYAVKLGRRSWVFDTQAEARSATPGGVGSTAFRGFSTLAEANAWLDSASPPGAVPRGNPAPPQAGAGRAGKTSCGPGTEFATPLDQYEHFSKLHATAEEPLTGDSVRAGQRAIRVYTDGACPKNGYSAPVGGVGVFFSRDDPRNLKERVPATESQPVTNNRVELIAIQRAVDAVLASDKDDLASKKAYLVVHTDSDLLVKSLTMWHKGWARRNWTTAKGEPIKNQDLLRPLVDKITAPPLAGQILIEHVSAHSGIPGNECADALAVIACDI